MKEHLNYIVLLLFLMSCKTIVKSPKELFAIPQGATNIEDNRFNPTEWSKAKKLTINDSLSLHVLQDESDLFLAVDFSKNDSTVFRWVELFFERNGQLYRLHASGQLGQQVLDGKSWTEDWNWGNNEKWISTKHGMNTTINRAYEFKIDKSFIGKEKIKFMTSISSAKKTPDFSIPPVHVHFPKGVKNTKSDGWLELQL